MNIEYYFIAWKSSTGATGQGKVSFPYEEANRMVDKLNHQNEKEGTNLLHYLVRDTSRTTTENA